MIHFQTPLEGEPGDSAKDTLAVNVRGFCLRELLFGAICGGHGADGSR
jgi:hypothetical protein